ncbi:alpha-amylase family glycosyl hydrolase [Lysobacter tyrosinilyticus]
MGRWSGSCVLALALAAAPLVRAAEATPAGLHVPSPDWRDQVIYFLMVDRFADGDASNNDQHAGEYDPADGARFSGGDLAGVRERLDYIRGLGATAIWITPPVANQWWSEASQYGGYHGYWARDFQAVDAHFGRLGDYQALSRAIHGEGMYLVQDVVVNHVGNYFAYSDGWKLDDPRAHFQLQSTRAGEAAPARSPFFLNDPRRRRDRDAAIYHWTPDIADYNDRNQELNWQLAGLDDLNTENPAVRDALRAAYGYWIREVGVDGFRVDTAFYVPPEYFADFLQSPDPRHPGMSHVAAATGRANFHVFGEGFGLDRAFDDRNARKIDSYMRGNGEGANTLLPGMINFPLYGTLGDVFARGRPTRELAWRIDDMMRVHAQPWLMPTFVDNHDVDRFLATGDEAGLKQALLAIMTLPGIPTIYYGTEQGFTGQRDAMFAGGFRAQDRDHFDTQAPLYRYLRRAIALRREHRVLSRGTPVVLAANSATPGVLAWRMDANGDSALIVFNSSDRPALLDNLATGLASDRSWRARFAIDGAAPALAADTRGRVSVVLPPRSGFVWEAVAAAAPHERDDGAPVLDAGALSQVSDDFTLRGHAAPRDAVQLVVDGDLAAAVRTHADAHGRWQARLDTSDMIDPDVPHSVVAWNPTAARASTRHEFRVDRAWRLDIEATDPEGDDDGPQGHYRYPLDSGWSERRPADLLGVKAWSSGGALKLQLRLRDVVAAWNPANGFDHVAFTVYLQLPGRTDGATIMPLQNATLPDGMRWHYRLRAHGWSNVLTSAAGASASNEGAKVVPGARIEADVQANTVTFTLPARSLDGVRSLYGARLYVTTWDYDGGYRGLAPTAGAAVFGGGEGASDPLVMDASAVLMVP